MFSKSGEEHKIHLLQVFQILRKERLYAKLAKCPLFYKETQFHSLTSGLPWDQSALTPWYKGKYDLCNYWPLDTWISF